MLFMWLCRGCNLGITEKQITEVDAGGKVVGCTSCQPDAQPIELVIESI